MAGGCITALYDARLVESSGFLYDCYLYPPGSPSAAEIRERDRYRAAFRSAFAADPPRVLIVSSDECGPPDFLYGKLGRWPWLQVYLARHYRLARERAPAGAVAGQQVSEKAIRALGYGYRIYELEQQ